MNKTNLGLLLLLCSLNTPLWAEPYRPTLATEVLEQLPLQGKHWLAIQALRQAVASQPQDLQPVLALVKAYIALGRSEADPRFYGYAEAALAPWLAQVPAHAEVLTLQATLYQNRHEFSAALKLLALALRQQPRLAQAWLTQAQIQEVQGDYTAALHSCKPLLRLAVPLEAAVCVHANLSLTGQLPAAYQQLQFIAQHHVDGDAAEQQWLWVTLAEMAERLGDNGNAERYYQTAFGLAERNGYLLATYADFLLDQQRYSEVEKLLQQETRHDGLLLRLTIAEQQLQRATLAEHINTLQLRFSASHLRGDTRHQAEEARFNLQLLHQTDAALSLAESNWQLQREPRDARIFLEAAMAKGDYQRAQPVIEFIQRHQLQDQRLAALLSQCQGLTL